MCVSKSTITNGRKELNQEFLADVRKAGFSLRDLAAMNEQMQQNEARKYYSELTCDEIREILSRADCMDLPDTMKLLFLKWVRSPFSQQESFPSFLTADIAREGLLSMAAAMGGSEQFDRLPRETEDCEAEEYAIPGHLFNKGSVNKASPAWNRPDFQSSA